MSIKIDDSGLKNLKNKLNEVKGPNSYKISELLSDSFMKEHTKFQSLNQFAMQSGFDWSTKESIEAIPDKSLDEFVSNNSSFSSWKEMLTSAGKELIAKKLGF